MRLFPVLSSRDIKYDGYGADSGNIIRLAIFICDDKFSVGTTGNCSVEKTTPLILAGGESSLRM